MPNVIFGIAGAVNEVVFNHHGENKLFLPGAFSKTLASGALVHLLLDHEPHKWLGSTEDVLELKECRLGLAFRVHLASAELRNYAHRMTPYDHESVSIGINYANAKKVTRRIDGVDVVCIVEAPLEEVSLIPGWNAGSSRRAFATLGDCPDLHDESQLAREAAANAFTRALKRSCPVRG